MKAKIARWGNSLALRLPKSLTSELALREDTLVEIHIADGQFVVKSASQVSSLEELVAGITPDNRHLEMDWGPSQGAEFC